MKRVFYHLCDHLNLADSYSVWRIKLCNLKKGQGVVYTSSISGVLSTKVCKVSQIKQKSWSQGNKKTLYKKKSPV